MILHSIDQGEGPPVLLLHGLFGAAKNLGVIARALAASARVTSLDLRNHGESPHDPRMDYPTMAADVAETMAAKNIDAATIIGHSMGGKTAMVLALTRPELVEKLAVLDIAPVSYRHGYEGYAAAMRALPLTQALTRHKADAALAGAIPEPDFRAFLLNNLILGEHPHWRLGLDEIAAAMANLVGWPDISGSYDGPALFLRGANSDYVRESARRDIASLFTRAEIETVPDAGHWLHAEQPQRVISALQGFLLP